jgi:hypothetical protein
MLPEDKERFREAAIEVLRRSGYDEIHLERVRLLMAGKISQEQKNKLTAAQWAMLDAAFEMLERATARLLQGSYTPIH